MGTGAKFNFREQIKNATFEVFVTRESNIFWGKGAEFNQSILRRADRRQSELEPAQEN